MPVQVVRLRCGIVNGWLLRGDGGDILVDAGNPGAEPGLERRLRAAGVQPQALKLVLLTHGHPDHTGAAEHFRQRYGIPVAMHPADARPTPPMTGRGLRGKLILAASQRMVRAASPPMPDLELCGGMRLDAYGVEAAVVALPGHTAGSVGVALPGGGLVAGDAYMNFGSPHTAHMAEDFEQLERTVAGLAQAGYTTIYPGHGGAFPFGRAKR